MDTASQLDRRLAVKIAHDHLNRLIESRVLDPGDPLPSAAQLSRDIGVSRPVVLDAFKLLQADGRLVVGRGPAGVRLAHPHGPQSKTKLAWLRSNQDTISQMAVLREFIEPGVARVAAEQGMPRNLMRRSRRIIAEFRSLPSSRQEILKLDAEFHRLIAEATGMPLLEEEAENCRVWVSPVFDFLDWPPNRIETSTNEHERILDAIDARDSDEAAKAALDHVRVSSGLIAKKIKELGRGGMKRASSQ